MEWTYVITDNFERDKKRYIKKRKEELMAVLDNLNRYREALELKGNSINVYLSQVHSEKGNVKAIDERGIKSKIKLQATRLYIYINDERKEIVLLKINKKPGKKEQNVDINDCLNIIKKVGYVL